MADFLNENIEGVKLLTESIDILQKELLKTVEINQKLSKSLDFSKIKDIQKLGKAVVEVNTAEEKAIKLATLKAKLDKQELDLAIKQEKELERLVKLEEKGLKVKKQSKDLTDEEIKAKIKLQKANAQRKKDLEAELILEQRSIETRRELKETIKALRVEADKLELGSDELAAANKEIDELTNSLKDVSDAQEQQRLNIGNYKSAFVDLTDSFEDQRKKLKILEDTYADAVSQGKKNTKEAKDLKEELKDQRKAVDDVTDSVKDLEDASESTSSAMKGLAKGTLIVAGIALIFDQLKEAFGNSREGSLELQKALANVTETVKVFFQSLVNAWPGAVMAFNSIKESAQSLGLSIEKAYLNLILLTQKGLDINPLQDYTEEIAKTNEEIADVIAQQAILDASTNTLANSYETITKAFEDQTSVTKNAIDSQQEYLKLQLATKISIEQQERALAGLGEKRQILQDISDDDTLGFETRALAVKKSQEADEEFAKLELQLALTKEKLTIQAVKQELLRSKVFTKAQLDEIKSGEALKQILLDKNIALKVSDESDQAFTEAFVERKDKQLEAESRSRDQEEKNRKTFRDSYEQRLDIIEEFGELQFAKNEEILNNDKNSQEERQKAFVANQKLQQDLFQQSVDLTLEQGLKSIELNEDLTDAEREIAKAKLEGVDINDILNSQTEEELFQKIRALDLGEIEEKRLKEAFKRKFEQNDALIAQNETLKESDRTALEIKKDIALQEVALKNTTNKKLDKLEQERKEDEIENLRERIALLKEDSIERLTLEQNLNDLLLESKEENLSKQKTLWEEYGDAISETLDKIFDKWQENQQKRIDSAEEEVERSEQREDEQRERAEEGLENTLKFEQENSARKEQALIQEQKRLEQIQKLEAFWNTYNANLNALQEGEGSGTALAKTLRDIAIIEGIATFEDGGVVGVDGQGVQTDSFGVTVGNRHIQGGIKAEFEGGEGFLSRKEIGNMGKENFYAIKKMAKENRISDLMAAPQLSFNNLDLSIRSEIDGLSKAIQSMQNQQVDVQKFANDIIQVNETVKKGKKTYINKHLISR